MADYRERAVNLRSFGIQDLHACLRSDLSFPNTVSRVPESGVGF